MESARPARSIGVRAYMAHILLTAERFAAEHTEWVEKRDIELNITPNTVAQIHATVRITGAPQD